MNCSFHNDREEVAKCNICKKPLCAECDKVQQKYLACPSCAQKSLIAIHKIYKRGLIFNVLGVLCFIAFVVLYVVDLMLGNLGKTFIILGAIAMAILGAITITMFVMSCLKLKRLNKIINLNKNIESKK